MNKLIWTAAVGALLLGCTKEPEKDAHLLQAEDLLSQKKYKAAAPEYDASLKANPNQGIDVYKQAAFTYVQISNYDRAAELLLKTVELEPTPAGKIDAYTNIAGIYLQSANKPEKAEKYFNEALKLDPKNVQTLTWLGEVASSRGGARAQNDAVVGDQLDRALGIYDQLIQIDPKRGDTWTNKRIAIVKYLSALEGSATAVGLPTDPAERKAKAERLHAQLIECNKALGDLSKPAPKP